MTDPKRKRIVVRYGSACACCLHPIGVGGSAWWADGCGLVCTHCHASGRRPVLRAQPSERARARVVSRQPSYADLLRASRVSR